MKISDFGMGSLSRKSVLDMRKYCNVQEDDDSLDWLLEKMEYFAAALADGNQTVYEQALQRVVEKYGRGWLHLESVIFSPQASPT